MDYDDAMERLERMLNTPKNYKMEVTNVEPLKLDQFYINRKSHLFKPDYIKKKGHRSTGGNKKCHMVTSTKNFSDYSI